MDEPEKREYFGAFCKKCGKVRGVYDKPERKKTKDGRTQLKGKCWSCGKNLIKYLRKNKKK